MRPWDIVTPSYKEAILATPGLASYWRMGEASGSVVDSVGSVTGTVSGTVTRNSTPLIAQSFDGSIDFDGSTGTVSFGDVYDFTGTVPFTVMLWAAADTFTNAANRILSKWSTAGGGWRIYVPTTGAVIFERRDNASGSDLAGSSTQNPMRAGVPYHITGTYDGAQMTFYGNAQLNSAGTAIVASTRSLPNTATALTVASQNSAASSWFDGKIDEIAVWNRALAASEVLDLYMIGRG